MTFVSPAQDNLLEGDELALVPASTVEVARLLLPCQNTTNCLETHNHDAHFTVYFVIGPPLITLPGQHPSLWWETLWLWTLHNIIVRGV